MKKVYDIYKHTIGLPSYIDICLADYEDGFTFETEKRAEECCNDMNAHNLNANYYYCERTVSDNYMI